MNITYSLPIRDRFLTSYLRSNLRGFSRIWYGMKKMGASPYIQVTNKYGAVFYLNPENYIDSHIIRSGYYESEVLEAILPFLDANAVFWDIGANFGLHAITAKCLRPKTHIICIEPSPIMLTQIQANSCLNQVKLEVVSVALSEASQFQTLHLVNGNPGMSTLKPWEKTAYSDQVICWCESGDYLVQKQTIPQPTVIKLDIEGSELEALLGMKAILANKDLKVIVFESGSSLLEQKTDPIYGILTEFGFIIKALVRQENTQHNLDNFIAVRDV